MGTFDPALREMLDDIHALLSAALFEEAETFEALIEELRTEEGDPYQLITALCAYVVGMLKVLGKRTDEEPEALFRRYLARTVNMDAGGEA